MEKKDSTGEHGEMRVGGEERRVSDGGDNKHRVVNVTRGGNDQCWQLEADQSI